MNEYDRLRRDWTAPPELAGSMREVRLSRAGTAMIVLARLLALGGVAGGIGLSNLAASQDRRRRTLEADGVRVQAVITRHWRTADRDSRPMLAYQFPLEGRIYTGQAGAPDAAWLRFRQGDPIDVLVLRSDPALNHPAEWRQSTIPRWLGLPVGAGLLALALVLQSQVRRQTALLVEGRPAPAVVTRHTRAKDGKRWHYEFPVPGGSKAKGSCAPVRDPPPVGATVCILYDPDHPKRNAAYPLPLVRLAR
jgi:hypothetical protein